MCVTVMCPSTKTKQQRKGSAFTDDVPLLPSSDSFLQSIVETSKENVNIFIVAWKPIKPWTKYIVIWKKKMHLLDFVDILGSLTTAQF